MGKPTEVDAAHNLRVQQVRERDARIAALEAEVEALKHDIKRAVQRNTDLLAEVEALKVVLQGICEHIPNLPYGDLPGEVEALREDAERYRWLRGLMVKHRGTGNWFVGPTLPKAETFDEALFSYKKAENDRP